MLKIKIANTEFEYLAALETEEYYNGSSRRTLTMTCAPDAIGMDELNALLVEENLASIALTNTQAIPVYKTETIVTTVNDEAGDPVDVQTEQNVLDENGQPVIDHYEAITNPVEGYVLKLECGIKNTLVQPESPDSAAVYADRLIFKLGRRTYIEEALHKLGL